MSLALERGDPTDLRADTAVAPVRVEAAVVASGALCHVGQPGIARPIWVDAASVVVDRDAHASGLSLSGDVDAHGRCCRMGVTGDVGQAFTHDCHDVVGEVGVDATVELIDNNKLVIQVGVDGASVECDHERGGKTQRGTGERGLAANTLNQTDRFVTLAQVVHDGADLADGLVDRCEG